MFNSPVLDTTIGLVFIFLLYSLLATSISEAIASLFALRGRMLRKGIIKGMLSNTIYCTDPMWVRIGNRFKSLRTKFIDDYCGVNTWGSFLHALGNFCKSLWRLISGREYNYIENTLGGDFYKHPIIKNYGASRRYSIPSYIGANNFSTVLLDTIDGYFSEYKHQMIYKGMLTAGDAASLPKISRISFVLDYFNDSEAEISSIDIETVQILRLYLRQAGYDLQAFTERIETWYDDSMDKVTGWYKQQMTHILFFLGLALAITFNVNIIDIAGKLSTDKDARDKLVALAIKQAENYENDSRVLRTSQTDTATHSYISMEAAKKTHDSIINNAKALINGDIKDASNLLALGWGDYGRKRDSLKIIARYKEEYSGIAADIKKKNKSAANAYMQTEAFAALYNLHKNQLKAEYVFREFFTWRNIGGYLLFSFGVCLGAPFWFDLLQKLIKIRNAGKKETAADGAQKASQTEIPVHVMLNNNNQNTEEAVG